MTTTFFRTKVLMALACLFITGLGFSADRINLRSNASTMAQARSANGDVSKALGLGANGNLVLLKERLDEIGQLQQRFQQTWKGIPIWGEHVIVTRDGGTKGDVIRMHGRAVLNINRDINRVSVAMTEKEALEAMKNQGATRERRVFENESSELVVYITERNEAKLAYAVSYFSDAAKGGAPSRPTFMVDANTGDVLMQFEGLTTADGTGPGGNNKTGQYNYGIDFDPMNVAFSGGTSTMNNTNVKTVNLNGGTSGSTAYSFSGTNNTFKSINGAFCPLNDAHFFGGVIYDMYQAWIGVPPLTFQLTMRVHYSTNYENAFWNGTSMTFGDGLNTFYPLVSLDVSAHEVSHGFTEQNSGLIYSAQSGGINEAFSDMAGEAAEYYMNGTNDFLVGAQIFKGNGALRYMSNPPLDGSSIGSANDYYSGMDVHYSSGVYNKAFYLLATTAGWNVQSAFQAFTKANQDYWTPSATYVTGAEGVRDAAGDLGFSTADVVNAFAAVDVNISGGGGGGNVPPSSSFTWSASGLTASFTDTSSDSDGTIQSRSWNFGDGGSSASTNPSHTYSADGTYTVSLTVTDNDGASTTSSQSVTVSSGGGGGSGALTNGVPVTGISGNTGDWNRFYIDVPANATNLDVVMSGSNGDADLYVRYNAEPSTSDWDCRPYSAGSNENCSSTNPAAGRWYVAVRAYSSFTGVSITATYDVGGSCPPYTDSLSGISGASGSWNYYTQEVPACATSVTVTISGGTGDADLYVNFGSQPTTSTWDCRPYKYGNSETCTFTNPATGTWHIGIRAYSAYSGVTLSVEYD